MSAPWCEVRCADDGKIHVTLRSGAFPVASFAMNAAAAELLAKDLTEAWAKAQRILGKRLPAGTPGRTE